MSLLTACPQKEGSEGLKEEESNSQIKQIDKIQIKEPLKKMRKTELQKIDDCIAKQKKKNLSIEKCIELLKQ